jgi:hypothetical protein
MLLDDDTSIARNYQKQFKKVVPVDYFAKSTIKRYYRAMQYRCKNSKSYKKKGTKVEISLSDFENFWQNNSKKIIKIQEAGYIVSVDRINSFGNYSLDNIRIIPNHINSALGKIEMLHAELKRLYLIAETLKDWV